jgi:hypothetical protein
MGVNALDQTFQVPHHHVTSNLPKIATARHLVFRLVKFAFSHSLVLGLAFTARILSVLSFCDYGVIKVFPVYCHYSFTNNLLSQTTLRSWRTY